MESKHHVKESNLKIKIVKINKIAFVETYTHKEWLELLQECHCHSREDRKEFIYIYCKCKKNSKVRINEHQKKGCEYVVDFEGNFLTLKVFPPLQNTIEVCTL
jgi:hypothetical protein